jgi:hypothetical protein
MTIHFDSPRSLAQHAIDKRAYYDRLGWQRETCAIGWHDSTVRMASDNGTIDYVFQADGSIVRQSHAGYSKLVEFVDLDVSRYVEHAQRHDPRRAVERRLTPADDARFSTRPVREC